MNPHNITREFEKALCNYTGAPYAVAVTSCTMALTLAVAWHLRSKEAWPVPKGSAYYLQCEEEGQLRVEIPKRTYVGVPYAIIEAGGRPTFRDEPWSGAYRLKPLPVWDSARWFMRGLFGAITDPHGLNHGPDASMVCVSFHASKTLGDTQGGAILHDNQEADAWLRRARFDGRTEGVAPKDDAFTLPRSWHCYLSPDVSARLLWQLSILPRNNAPLPNDAYPDLSQLEVFK